MELNIELQARGTRIVSGKVAKERRSLHQRYNSYC